MTELETILLAALESIHRYLKGSELYEHGYMNYPDKPEISPADIVKRAIAKAKGK